MDQLDRLESQVVRGTRANVDPTLILKDEERFLRKNPIVRKGAGAVIPVSPQGDASYLEMSGTSIKVGIEVINKMYHQICETVECVIVDANNAGAYRSGEAMQMLWRSMEAKSNRLRVPLTGVMRSLCRVWIALGKAHGIANTEDENPGEGILLPPVVDKAPVSQDELKEAHAAGEESEPRTLVYPQKVGTGSHVIFTWPPYWNPTTQQENEKATAMTSAVAGGLLSAETGVHEFASFIGIDPTREQTRITREKLESRSELDAALEREIKRKDSSIGPEDGEEGEDEGSESETESEDDEQDDENEDG
jgi:hypothetical protein